VSVSEGNISNDTLVILKDINVGWKNVEPLLAHTKQFMSLYFKWHNNN